MSKIDGFWEKFDRFIATTAIPPRMARCKIRSVHPPPKAGDEHKLDLHLNWKCCRTAEKGCLQIRLSKLQKCSGYLWILFPIVV